MFESKRSPVPQLDPLIERFAESLRTGDRNAAAELASPAGAESLSQICGAIAAKGPFSSAAVTARARIGMQYVAKIRLKSDRGGAMVTARWREENGRWVMCEMEDLSSKPSPWSDIPALKVARLES